eukprot:CAMPEP_0172531210 /NCGR_PEP_ID=MMETSP1067-20121228/4703_1 /TAXON_ID=265564 ORGANISM="Thalassiosira punctigera, Strain Tpunct2005C2" /NCGR_SAMPLE_ID=MMETSP1067 /ASSEMBLY_ACC=CAM_ASM_000444 /LENGTH=375 /DNA_ID=CAMNT_0013315565 /DNA_START=29 /DNA_END=1156 /DNA_ORIENTATION=-
MNMMNISKVLLFSQFCAAASSSTSLRGDRKSRELRLDATRIIGGSEATEDLYSYAVSLQDRGAHFCGGSLVARNAVLTAAHCLQSRAGYKAVVGRHDLRDRDGYVATVTRQIRHPRYNSQRTDNDFAILILDRDIYGVNLVELSPDFVPGEAAVTVMGWGDTHKSDNIQALATGLMETEVFTISNSVCARSSGTIGGQEFLGMTFGGYQASYAGQITNNMICAQDVGEDSCQGDSGGPMVVRRREGSAGADVQVGVVSWGMGCAHPEFPGVYARISSQYDWIRGQVCEEGSDPPASYGCNSDIFVSPPATSPPTPGLTPKPTAKPTQKPFSAPLPAPTPKPIPSPEPAPAPTPPASDTNTCSGFYIFGICWFDWF